MLNPLMPYAVELNGSIFQSQHGELAPLDDLGHIEGDCLVVTDFQDAIARTMTVEADTRYVELMISRKLQETGEFDESVTVITHWKKKRGKNVTDIFFTAMRSKQYYHYLEMVAEHGGHLVLLPLQSILLTMLQKYGKAQPVAVVFQHDRFADVLIGTRKKVWYANRVVAFDSSDEQMTALWETLRSDIASVGTEHRRPINHVYVADWIDNWGLPQWTDDDGPELIPVEKSTVSLDQAPTQVSLPILIHETPKRNAVASRKDKLLLAARRVLPYFNAAMLLAVFLLGVCGFWYDRQADLFSAQIEKMHQDAVEIQRQIPLWTSAVPYKSELNFIQGLWISRQLPTYSQILQDVRQGMSSTLKIENLNAIYSDGKVEVKAFGSVSAPFETAHKRYRALQDRLRKRGYRILTEQFDTQINASSFLIHFAKEV